MGDPHSEQGSVTSPRILSMAADGFGELHKSVKILSNFHWSFGFSCHSLTWSLSVADNWFGRYSQSADNRLRDRAAGEIVLDREIYTDLLRQLAVDRLLRCPRFR